MKTRRIFRTPLCSALAAVSLAGASQVSASVVIAGTRVIYNAGEPETTIRLTNNGKAPSLTQVWIDKGDINASPSNLDVPFTVTPPVSRLDPSKAQTLRIAYTGEALPQDKETVFWLNVLDIPPKAKAEGDVNLLQLAFRSRIKLFFRPAGLHGQAEEAPMQVTWKLVRGGIEASNPTSYHVSYAAIEVKAGSKVAKFEDGGMVGPGETKVFPLKGDVTNLPDAKVLYQAINDWGGSTTEEASLK
ncbi:fimbria/pilus periplasmic chaperone [Cupriavidus basilensis]|uniref:Fimbria/pilus periplasmic chaperone n=1 Tax=Cupriavidus basilensis TaxID=68895 RepID=A0ABT6B2Q1_9BURK|nr:fimbria/pilus periplasmic chaperone [Cupriavidus basilensis]MDF3839160.1 fimbria/pilus periplasmic chaperone [Cupriavidus basilensis]